VHLVGFYYKNCASYYYSISVAVILMWIEYFLLQLCSNAM